MKLLTRSSLALAFCFSTLTQASELIPQTVDVFVTQEQIENVVNVSPDSKGLQVNVIDQINVMDETLTASLPKYTQARFGNSENYQNEMITLVKQWTTDHKQELIDASHAVSKGISLQITHVPAVIINGKYVVYGDTVSSAVAKWRKAESTKGRE